MRTSRTLWAEIALILTVVAMMEGFAYSCLWLLQRAGVVRAERTATILRDQTERVRGYFGAMDRREETDPLLGWRYRASFERGGDLINAQGLRSSHQYQTMPPAGMVRVAVFGDSFVYGNEVDTKDAWTTKAEQFYPDLEVLNYGVGGYGDDQAYLRFRHEGLRLSPQVVILGFTPDDLRRLTNVYRRFIDDREFAWTKPRFRTTANDSLILQLPPIRDSLGFVRLLAHPRAALDFGRNDQWFEPAIYRDPLYDYSATVRLLTVLGVRVYNKYFDHNRLHWGDEFNPSSEAFHLQLAISTHFVSDARRAGKLPLLLMLPDRFSIEQTRSGRRAVYGGLIDSLRARGLPVIDVVSAFLAQPNGDRADWFAKGGHYSPKGNAIVGRAVGREVEASVRDASNVGGSLRTGHN